MTLIPFAQSLTWEKTYGGSGNDYATCIIETLDNGYAAAGWTDSKGFGGGDAWILKLDSDGNLLWDKTYGGNNDEEAYSIIQTSDRGYMFAGYTKPKRIGGFDALILKLEEEAT